MFYEVKNGIIEVKGIECLNLELTLDCGQAFRWQKCEDGSFVGCATDKPLKVSEENGTYFFEWCSEKDFLNFWVNYFDLNTDYAKICESLKQDSLLSKTIDEYYGIRILKQNSFEALFSFVISQQNNIKRIKLIIEKICRKCGKDLGHDIFSFPDIEVLVNCTEQDFAELGCGYRAKYLYRLCQDVYDGKIDLDYIASLSYEDAKKELLKIFGVGVKVADCALLFGFGFVDAFPIDVWMKRVMEYYPNGLPKCFDGYKGIAQQYLFHWARNNL